MQRKRLLENDFCSKLIKEKKYNRFLYKICTEPVGYRKAGKQYERNDDFLAGFADFVYRN